MAQQRQAQPKQKSLDDVRKGGTSGGSIPEKWRTPLAIASIFLVLLVFFNGVLSKDKAFHAGDNIASESILPYLKAAQAAGTAVPQWIPNIFCGMPSFASLLSTGERVYDLAHEVFDLVRAIPVAMFGGNDAMIHIWHYFMFGLGMYLLLRFGRKTSHLVAFFAAFAAMFSTWVATYVMIGHNTKVFAVMCFPYILLALEKLREEKLSWQKMVFWCSALAISVHLLFESSHPQMIFYQFLAILIYFLVWLISDIIGKRNIIPVFRTGILSLVMIALAFLMSADRYFTQIFEYDQYSIRGASPLVDRSELGNNAPAKATSTSGAQSGGGLDWNYATEYSFSPGEMITFLVPGWFGFGKLPYNGPEVPPDTKVPTYWGQMSMTDAANYMGVIVFFLGLIGIFALWKKDRLVAPLAIISIVSLFLSFGSTMPLLFKPMFEYFPAFNKFRAPMMALVLMQMCFPILAALTLQRIIDSLKSDDKALKAKLAKYTTYAFYTAAGLFVLFLVGRGIIDGSLRSSIKASGKPLANYPQGIQDLAVSTALNDAAICLLLAAMALGALWMYVRGKLRNPAIAVGLVVLLTVIDLWRIDYRPLEITTKADYDQSFAEHDWVQFIKQDKSLFRVLDLTEPTSNIPAAWGFQTISGYHAAKMRTYQDVVDVTGNAQGYYIMNPFMWGLLNCKYIIANGGVDSIQGRHSIAFISNEKAQGQDGKPQQTVVWKNNAVMPRAFFVRGYEVHPPKEFLGLMRDQAFYPGDVVFFDKQPEGIGTPSEDPIDASETVNITKYENESVEIKYTAKAQRLLFMSDSWYPNWSAKIDGTTPITIHKADWAFRALSVPAGSHTITFTYTDNKYETGRTVAMGANVIAILGLILGLATTMKRKKEKPVNSEA